LEYSNIIGFYNELDLLCASTQEQIDIVDQQYQTFSFFDSYEQCLAQDLSK
jgi:hypothetical protein